MATLLNVLRRIQVLTGRKTCVFSQPGEVLARLVAAAVFKTVGTCVKRWFGGFDSHALPFLFFDGGSVDLTTTNRPQLGSVFAISFNTCSACADSMPICVQLDKLRGKRSLATRKYVPEAVDSC